MLSDKYSAREKKENDEGGFHDARCRGAGADAFKFGDDIVYSK